MREAILRDAACLYGFMSACPPPEKSDFILVLGCHDLRVPDHAVSLYFAGLADLIVCTGGYGKMTEGVFPRPEGELFAERCLRLGVPADAVIIENRSTNTGENFVFSKGLVTGKRAVAVCKPYMARRALATGRMQWPGIQWSVSVPDIPFELYSPDEDSLKSEIELMVGDLQRLRVYADKGWQAPVPVPEEVWEAWKRLVRLGFDRYVIRENGQAAGGPGASVFP